VEHGVDIVASLRDRGSLTAVLARRKIRMRSGETDKAVTVDRGPFMRASELIARAADLTGLIDVDMFIDAAGRVSVIDINPRFGGGYPFVHLAGANVPLYYLAQPLDLDIDQGWGRFDTDIVSAKYESLRVTRPSPRSGPCPSGHSDHRAPPRLPPGTAHPHPRPPRRPASAGEGFRASALRWRTTADQVRMSTNAHRCRAQWRRGQHCQLRADRTGQRRPSGGIDVFVDERGGGMIRRGGGLVTMGSNADGGVGDPRRSLEDFAAELGFFEADPVDADLCGRLWTACAG